MSKSIVFCDSPSNNSNQGETPPPDKDSGCVASHNTRCSYPQAHDSTLQSRDRGGSSSSFDSSNGSKYDESVSTSSASSLTFTSVHHSSHSQRVSRRRISCHRCGNIRKRIEQCTACPHVYCGRCRDKVLHQHGPSVFIGGCPVCKLMCCCAQKSESCHLTFHCYKKCPASKAAVGAGQVQNQMKIKVPLILSSSLSSS